MEDVTGFLGKFLMEGYWFVPGHGVITDEGRKVDSITALLVVDCMPPERTEALKDIKREITLEYLLN